MSTPNTKTPFPEEKLEKYLKGVNGEDVQSLNLDQLKTIFLLLVKDFTEKSLCLDELSSVSMDLFHFAYLTKSEQEKMGSRDLGDALWSASELDFYIRNAEDDINANTLKEYIQQVLRFYHGSK